MLEHMLSVLSETHGLIISGEPAGLGWLLGIGVLLFYGTLLFVLWGLIRAVLQRNTLLFILPIER